MTEQRPQDKYVKVGEVNVRYWVQGSQGSTVILIHGIGAAVDSWAFNINVLAKKHRVYAMDLVGFGLSDKPVVEYSLPFFSKFISDFMEKQNIDRANLVGWSFGGGFILQFAIDFPDKLDKLILSSSIGFGKEIHLMFRMSSIPLIGKLLSRPSRKGIAWLLKESVYMPDIVTDELVDLYYQFATLPGGHEAWLAIVRDCVNFGGVKKIILQNLQKHFSSINAQTLVIWGKQDRFLPFIHAYKAEKKLPTAEVYIIDQCGHCPQIERPEAFNARVIEFLNK